MSLHLPEAARIRRQIDLDEDRELIFADAIGEANHSAILSDDPTAWRAALASMIVDTDAEITLLNAEIQSKKYPHQRRDANLRRAAFVDQKSMLVNRLRYVKTLIPSAVERSRIGVGSFEGDKFQQAQAHLRAANRLLKEWAVDHCEVAS